MITFFRNKNFNGKHLAKLRYKNNVIEFQNTKMMAVESMELFIKPKTGNQKNNCFKEVHLNFQRNGILSSTMREKNIHY